MNIFIQPTDVTKVVLTHKHPDHAGELRLFDHAKIYLSHVEADAMNIDGENIIMLPGFGHTTGNSLVVVYNEGIHYMIHGDITYTDEALRQNQLSVVFEDKDLAKETLETVRTFIKENDTVYLSTHTPEGVSSLKNNTIMKL